MRQGFPISTYICKGLSMAKMLHLNNLIIHMQICKWETENKNQRKQNYIFDALYIKLYLVPCFLTYAATATEAAVADAYGGAEAE